MRDVLTSAATIYTIGVYDEDDPEKNEGVLRKLAHCERRRVLPPEDAGRDRTDLPADREGYSLAVHDRIRAVDRGQDGSSSQGRSVGGRIT
jgi:hypothetical protein